MEGFFEKFGLYDFFSMFVAGIISESIAIIIASKCFGVNIEWTAEITWLFLIIGYFVGLILHEMKNIVEDKLREDKEKEGKQKKGSFKKLLKNTFSRSVANEEDFFDDKADKEMLKRVKKHILGENEEDRTYITSVCVNELQIKGAITSPDRLKTQSEMALSICIATALIGIGTFILGIIYSVVSAIIVSVILFSIISILFYIRSIRMHKHYIRCLIRTYAVLNGLDKNKGEQEI